MSRGATITLIRPEWPAPDTVHSASTTRLGGVSQGVYAGLNLAAHVGDDAAAVTVNRRRLRRQLGLGGTPVWLAQRHGARIVDAGAVGPDRDADGSFATRPEVVCAVLTADCLPVLLCDRSGTRVAAVHAGWRGLLAGVLEAAVRALGPRPDSVMAWIGPGIGRQAYTVSIELRDRFLRSRPGSASAFHRHQGRWHADLAALAALSLVQSGVAEVHVHGACTFRERERFFSYRRDGRTGRMATLIWLRAD